MENRECAIVVGLNNLITNFTKEFGHIPVGLLVCVEVFEHLVADHSLSKKPIDNYNEFRYKDIPVYMGGEPGVCVAMMAPRDIPTYKKLKAKDMEEFKREFEAAFEQEDENSGLH